MTSPASRPKVSVVVATYCPGAGLQRVLSSLAAQTMPADEFEVIFVDDGSPDDTWQRLEQVRAEHANVRTERIEHSGWPSRPRNVGLELADGEYVLFMDHDDELYPDALRAGYTMAARNGADVLNGKETRTDQPGWAVEVYPHNFDNAVHRADVHPLVPTNPHKLFRRELLMRHGIRFPDAGRMLWEDVLFCLDLAPHVDVVSVLADTPFYHWVRGGPTASSSFRSNPAEYWRWLREIVVRTNERLAAPYLAGQRRLMLQWQYRERVLPRIDAALFAAPPDARRLVRDAVTELLEHLPVELDDELSTAELGRAVLLRGDRWDLLPDYVGVDTDVVGLATCRKVEWADGRFQLHTTARWATADGRPAALRHDGEQVVRDLPTHVRDALPDAAVDVSGDLAAARVTLGLRGRRSAVTWLLGTTGRPRVADVDGRPEIVVEASAELDPRTAALGGPLDEPTWDVYARCELMGRRNQRRVRTALPARTVVTPGHVYVAYGNNDAMLSLDMDEHTRSLTGSGKLDPTRGHAEVPRTWSVPAVRRRAPTAFRIPFTRVTADPGTVLTGQAAIGDGDPLPAQVRVTTDGVWLEGAVPPLAPGTHALQLQLFGRAIRADVSITVDRRGRVSFDAGS